MNDKLLAPIFAAAAEAVEVDADDLRRVMAVHAAAHACGFDPRYVHDATFGDVDDAVKRLRYSLAVDFDGEKTIGVHIDDMRLAFSRLTSSSEAQAAHNLAYEVQGVVRDAAALSERLADARQHRHGESAEERFARIADQLGYAEQIAHRWRLIGVKLDDLGI